MPPTDTLFIKIESKQSSLKADLNLQKLFRQTARLSRAQIAVRENEH